MQESISNNRRIAKNTLFLYFRMMITMLITLYTSRVILRILGVDDYGIYQSVGGIVGLLSFLNAALSTGTSRFMAHGLGEGKKETLNSIFNTTLTCHIILAIGIIIIAETFGYWFLHHKLVIPPDRMEAAEWVFHFSISTVFFTLTQVPYNACIIAHENMKVYAYVSIVDAVLKLLIVYALQLGRIDKLVLYAILQFSLQASIVLFYRIYCKKKYDETRFRLGIDKGIFKEIIGFSGWSLFSNSAIALNNQGMLLLLNMFFTPAVVAARSLSIQVEMAAYHFMTNFQTATVPQIVKRYAQKDYRGSRTLLLNMTKYSFYLMLLLAVPIFFSAGQLLTLWLGEVPPFTKVFLQIIIIQSLFQVFDTSFYKALYAKGRLKENALLSPTCLFLNFILIYLLFKLSFSPIAMSISTALCYAVIGLVIKPILLVKIVDFKWSEIWSVELSCLKVLLFSLPVPLLAYFILKRFEMSNIAYFLIIVSVCVLSVALVIWFLGLTSAMRKRFFAVLKAKLHKK